jgi:hypothetical protein
LKKRSKKLLLLSGRCWGQVRDSDQKFFGSFFQKRTSFLPLTIGDKPRALAYRAAKAYIVVPFHPRLE